MTTRNAIIVHGKPSKEGYYNPETPSASNSIWIPWLQNELTRRGISTQTPEMLRSFQPDYTLWNETFGQFKVTSETMLIGHSCGGGFLLQWLCEHKDVSAGHVYLVAPAFGDVLTPEAPYEEQLLNGFGKFDLDKRVLDRVASLTLVYTDNDSPRVNGTVECIRKTYPRIERHLFSRRGHFTRAHDSTVMDTFPELVEMIESKIAESTEDI